MTTNEPEEQAPEQVWIDCHGGWVEVLNDESVGIPRYRGNPVKYVRADLAESIADEAVAERAVEHYNAGWDAHLASSSVTAPQGVEDECRSQGFTAGYERAREDAAKERKE